jgi:hypothetical protein
MTTTTTTTADDGHSRRSQDAGALTPSVGPSLRGLDAGACLGRGPFVAARHACAWSNRRVRHDKEKEYKTMTTIMAMATHWMKIPMKTEMA